MDDFVGFDWDDGNREKCTKHGVSIVEIESVFDAPVVVIPDIAHSLTEKRKRIIGRAASGRHVFVVFTLRKREADLYIRPISARYMHRKEVTNYEEANPAVEKDAKFQDG
ncbi:MAG: BrnT family toxin [Bauldia sp.]